MIENGDVCPICGNDNDNHVFVVKEMMIGLREDFEYVECSNCGCLFLKDVPENMSRYYDSDYGPHQNNNNLKNKMLNKVVGLYLSNNSLISTIAPKDAVPPVADLIKGLVASKAITKKSAVLDVGCGQGNFLNYLKLGGFKDLTGIDLFMEEKNMIYDFKFIQSSLEDFNTSRKFDLILSNHSFEHMPNQLVNMKCLENLVSDEGLILLRIPVKSKFVWDTFGVNWYQIDAPRHLFLHTVKSLEILCSKTNLVIEDIIFDSSHLLFTNSQKYCQDIAMRDENWNSVTFSDDEIKNYKQQVKKLNEDKNADQATFILKLKK
ncbi:MAG: methyltransferase domain-containing protein [Methanobrevibacter sp.]|nr:class I SAM-dependent methyltransferase [Methanobrevibacter sp.]MBE6491290.1 methyltransferase domain-containing protein [Methanobrevibacter sp.]